MGHRQHGLNALARRKFLKRAAGASLAAGVGPWLASCGFSSDSSGGTESRTLYFDLSNADHRMNYYLVAGTTHHAISPITSRQLAAARDEAPALLQVSSDKITHVTTAALPADEIQMCYVKAVSADPAAAPGEWMMHLIFYHVPSATTAVVGKALATSGKSQASLKFAGLGAAIEKIALAGLGIGNAEATNYCAGSTYDQFKDYFDHAMALVCHHPEIGTFDAATLSYVQQSIICTRSEILALAQSLYTQGPATTKGGWATLVAVIDPDTGKPKLNSNGDIQYFTHYSEETLKRTGAAIRSILPLIKNDPVLGANITDLSADADNASLSGKLWAVRNGTLTGDVAPTSAQATGLLGGPAISWAAHDVSSGSGCNIGSVRGDNRTVSFTVSNWFVRYLGLFIRYFDGAGRPIAYGDLPIDIQQQFPMLPGSGHSDQECFLSLINPEFVVLGVPIKQSEQRFSIQVPAMAASFEILAGGLGRGRNDYPKTIPPGAVMTVVLELAIPGVFLAMAACSGYKAFKTKVNSPSSREAMVAVAKLFITAISDSVLAGVYHHPDTFKNLASPLLSVLTNSGSWLYSALKASLAEGAAEGAATSCLPFGVGLGIQAVMALGTATEISQTSAELANSPWTYATKVSATHNLTVTINHDPRDTAGFPSNATHYVLYAVCDGSSPRYSDVIAMSTTTATAPLVYVFQNLPSGGKVNVTVHFFSKTGWLAGAGSTGPVDNTVDSTSITITEVLVPLSSATIYSHKQKIVLDAAGNHVWQASSVAPLVQSSCGNVAGSLCDLAGITLSEHFGAIGYEWHASSAGVRNFANGAGGQMYQFANISFTDRPESGYKFSGGGFSTPARLAYDLSSPTSNNFYIDTSSGANIVRRITMTAVDKPPVIDMPDSNLSVGQFNHASDAFLIHPTGKLISINTALSKFEVLVPASRPVADAVAPLAQAYSGPGTREGLLQAPACMSLTPGGAILVIEQANNRIQAFDTGANPVKIFANNTSSTMPLRQSGGGAKYLDLAVEAVGYLYVLSATGSLYTLDIYDPHGQWLSATTGVNAGKLTVDLFRNLYTLNYETLKPVGNVTEPSISQWIPSTPAGS